MNLLWKVINRIRFGVWTSCRHPRFSRNSSYATGKWWCGKCGVGKPDYIS